MWISKGETGIPELALINSSRHGTETLILVSCCGMNGRSRLGRQSTN